MYMITNKGRASHLITFLLLVALGSGAIAPTFAQQPQQRERRVSSAPPTTTTNSQTVTEPAAANAVAPKTLEELRASLREVLRRRQGGLARYRAHAV
jgi:uncharacterized protein HemX